MKKKNNANSYGIIGLGRFGMALVECLASAGKEVIAIDKDETRVREARRLSKRSLYGCGADNYWWSAYGA